MVKVIELFAGCGGFSLGLQKAGYNVLLSAEIDKIACETLKLNKRFHNSEILNCDLTNLSGFELKEKSEIRKGDKLIIPGGPPCQPFSKAAYWTDPGNEFKYRMARKSGVKIEKPQPITIPKNDIRRSLLGDFVRIINETNADGFIFENVVSITHPRNLKTFNNFLNKLKNSGYKIKYKKINAVEYGIPQKRERIIILGSKKMEPTFPEPRYRKEIKTQAELFSELLDPITVGKVINHLDKDEYFEKEEIVTGKWYEVFKTIPPGMNYKARTEWAGDPNPVFKAETRFWTFLLKLHPDMPSWTISAQPGPWTGPFHWKDRRLRTIELAAIQSFPVDYKFAGNKRERIKQIGNAIPPLLVENLSKDLVNQI